ncbi:TPA: hypothetical protein DDZ01_03230 [Candidatus Uhrbacteria bacterium]|nr:MAG: hypothetical protein A2332_03700 [Candidatus Uhrbacteria bacterium RIFOXYB2_FULL_41_18]HBK34982.1 hypothetical protein [Candidatus Uhrbacteria bacterium]
MMPGLPRARRLLNINKVILFKQVIHCFYAFWTIVVNGIFIFIYFHTPTSYHKISSPSWGNKKPPLKLAKIFWLAWRDSFRTFDWRAAFPVPELVVPQVRHLLSQV